MKKVVYSVSRYVKGELNKITGLGYITDEDLVIACMSQNGKPYIRIFDGCVKKCYALPDKENEFRGAYYEIREIEVEDDDGKKDIRTIELDYRIWYKLAD